ncbi:unnamed protein product [Ilex paraguariensis]|uniref:Uncharacterized protein n=1 Tax=Ilex paraguariensis TaxID=185542 RepID=A0ABC8T887_9AQUA
MTVGRGIERAGGIERTGSGSGVVGRGLVQHKGPSLIYFGSLVQHKGPLKLVQSPPIQSTRNVYSATSGWSS